MRALIVIAVLMTGTAAEAQATKSPERAWHLGIEALTDFPLQVGFQVWLEMPYRLRVTVSSGEMPDAYLQTINKILTSSGVYNDATADFMTELLDRAMTWRLQFGWRPFPRRGGYVEGGFGILDVEKSLAVADVIHLATGLTAPQEANVGFGYEGHTTVETLGVEIGWIWFPWRDLTVRFSLGFAAPVGAQVSITPNFASTIQRPFTQAAEARGEELIEKYLFIPTIGLAAGWRLF